MPSYVNCQAIDSLKALYGTVTSSPAKQYVLIKTAEEFAKIGLPDSSIHYLTQAKNFTTEADTLKLQWLMGFTRAYYTKGKLIKAIEFGKKLEALIDRYGKEINEENLEFISKYKLGIAFTLIGEIYRKLADYEKALKYAMKSKEIAEITNDQVMLASNYNNIGIIHNRLGEFSNAKKNYLIALSINKQLPENAYRIASNYNNLGLIYRTSNSLDSAFYYFNLALQYIKSPYGVATILGNIGGVHYDLKAYDSALIYHKKAMVIQEKNGYLDQKSLSMINIGGVLRKLNQLDESIAITREAYEQNQKQNNTDLMEKAAQILANVYEDNKDYKNSLFYHKKFKTHHDSIFNRTKNNEIVNYQLKFDVLEKEKELEKVQQEATLNATRLEFQIVLSIILGIVVMLIIWLFYSYVKRKKIKQALTEQQLKNQQSEKTYLKKELNFKNKELVNFALQIVEKNNFILKVEQDIVKLAKNGLNGNDEVSALLKKLKTSYLITKHQKEFDAHVNSVNSSFYQKLEEHYPSLTQNEKRLTALLRLQLSSKEISSIIGISPKSVDMNRYRLRKKLNLETEDNLITILNNL